MTTPAPGPFDADKPWPVLRHSPCETFGKIVSVLMQSGAHREWPPADLARLVAPALMAGSSAIIDAENLQTFNEVGTQTNLGQSIGP